jgi:hypothetical protein
MIGVLVGHVGGIPIEETVGSLGPALLACLGVAWANLRSRLGRVRAHTNAHARFGPKWRGIEPLTFGATPKVKAGDNPVTERAREDSNL